MNRSPIFCSPPIRHLVWLTAFSLAPSLVYAAPATPSPPPTLAQPIRAESRGAMLYSVSCEGCHSKNLHWRAQKQVTDQASLLREVLRWRDNAQASWSEADSKEVARYLNTTYYQFAR